MPAYPTDIIRVTRPAKIVTRSDTDVLAVYPAARDAISNPDPGYFEDSADADTVLTLKAALIGQRRRRFRVDVEGEVAVVPLVEVPSFRLIDSELGVDITVMLARLEYDMENDMTALEVVG